MADTDIQTYVKEHPKLLGVLFGLVMLSTQVGSASAAIAHTLSGP